MSIENGGGDKKKKKKKKKKIKKKKKKKKKKTNVEKGEQPHKTSLLAGKPISEDFGNRTGEVPCNPGNVEFIREKPDPRLNKGGGGREGLFATTQKGLNRRRVA